MTIAEDIQRQPTPASLGYRMPAEWEPHEATWLSWPKKEGFSFPGNYEQVLPVFRKMVEALVTSEEVRINVNDEEEEQRVRKILKGVPMERVRFFHIPTNEPWCRDHGPIFVSRREDPKLAIIKWQFNAWGWKYTPFELDDDVADHIASQLGVPIYYPGAVLEGGSIDVNGEGTLLTTKACLLNENRNPDLSQKDIEQILKDHLGIRKVLWLGEGIEGDDTDGHIDDLARFIAPNTVVTAVEEDPEDPNYGPLQENLAALREMKTADGEELYVMSLPMPAKIVRQGMRLPASYANFYIANEVILMPAYADTADSWAQTILQQAFPTRRVIPIDCRELIWGLGAFHCLTQQQPALP
jgi:agmatine deiminase